MRISDWSRLSSLTVYFCNMHFILPVILCLGMISTSMLQAQRPVEKLPAGINTPEYDETTPVISRYANRLFFTRTADPDFNASIISEDGQLFSNKQDLKYQDRLVSIYTQLAGHDVPNPASSVYNQDIWFASLEMDSIGDVVHPGYPLNNALPNCLVSTGMQPEEYVVLNQFYADGSMYSGFSRTQIDQAGRSAMPQPMHIYQFNVTKSDVDLTMSPDGQVLVMSMRRSDSEGQNDLYVSFFMRDNVWSTPLHMGKVLNSDMQESSPHISPDKRYLYFSSNRPGGVGGTDIYVSERLNYSWLKWSAPKLVEGTANSVEDDSQPYFDPSMSYLYFASRREGSSDIYRINQAPKPVLKKAIYVRGKILNSETGKPVHSELFWGQDSSEGYLEYFNTYTGEFELSLTEAEPYKFQPRKSNHLSQKIIVDPIAIEKQGLDTINLVLFIDPKVKNEPVMAEDLTTTPVDPSGPVAETETMTFYNINFVKGKTILLSRSKPALDFLQEWMEDHPQEEIMIVGHTDDVGDEVALFDLSLRRAEAVRDYLSFKGIELNRMQISGKGATEALSSNLSEGGRARNRRVEVKVLK